MSQPETARSTLRRRRQIERVRAGRIPLPEPEVKRIVLEAAAVGCTYDEMSALVLIEAPALRARYGDEIAAAHSRMRMSLRHRQFQLAMDEKNAMAAAKMLVHLGLNELGQVDRRAEVSGSASVQLGVISLSADRIREMLDSRRRDLGEPRFAAEVEGAVREIAALPAPCEPESASG